MFYVTLLFAVCSLSPQEPVDGGQKAAPQSGCQATAAAEIPTEIVIRWKRFGTDTNWAPMTASMESGVKRLTGTLQKRNFKVLLETLDRPRTGDRKGSESVVFINGVALSNWLQRSQEAPQSLDTPSHWEEAIYAAGMLAAAEVEQLAGSNDFNGSCSQTTAQKSTQGKSKCCAIQSGCGDPKASRE